MKYFADVTILNTEVTEKKDDPKTLYKKVLFYQGVSTDVLICPNDEVFNLCDSNKGKNAQIEVDYNPTYKSIKLLDVVIDCN